MRGNPSSDIPRARALIYAGIELRDWDYIEEALPLLFRAKAVRRAKAKQKPITAAQKLKVHTVAGREPNTTYHEIANRFGLANGGRVSEILTGKRK